MVQHQSDRTCYLQAVCHRQARSCRVHLRTIKEQLRAFARHIQSAYRQASGGLHVQARICNRQLHRAAEAIRRNPKANGIACAEAVANVQRTVKLRKITRKFDPARLPPATPRCRQAASGISLDRQSQWDGDHLVHAETDSHGLGSRAVNCHRAVESFLFGRITDVRARQHAQIREGKFV